MDIVTTSLEALIQRATCSQNQCPDTAAIDAFCGLVNKEAECTQTATRFITAKVHSLNEWEALQALHVLDACMKRCGSNFHAEVGKFRFLNELIKLVSPKYNGAHTPDPVKRRVLELMQSWTVYYPREFKIKEAYEMLKKQGVVKEEVLRPQTEGHKSLDQNIFPPTPRRPEDTIFQDTEKSRLLQKLLQSKNPDDLQAANRLIKTMVKEDERRVELKSRHLSELEAAHNNARLLAEMLDTLSRDGGSAQDRELIDELHSSCQRFRPNVQKLLSEVHTDERLFNEVLAANDELGEVLDKYAAVIVRGEPVSVVGGNLLDLSSPAEDLPVASPAPASAQPQPLIDDLSALDLGGRVDRSSGSAAAAQDLVSLQDVFNCLASPVPLLPPTTVPIPPVSLKPLGETVAKTGLEELDALSESLLRQSLPQTAPPLQPKAPIKLSMNQLSQQASPAHVNNTALHSSSVAASHDLLHSASAAPPLDYPHATPAAAPFDQLDLLIDSTEDLVRNVNGDTSPPIDITVDPLKDQVKTTEDVKTEPAVPEKTESASVKPIGDLTVSLDSIKPGTLPPLTVLEEHNVSVTIHFARDTPRPDVSVFVVTTTSKSQFPITDYLFQAIVPKGCKLRLQPPSSTELPAHNPFLPPAAITQVLLVASSHKEPILLRVVVSFTMDDETITEMKEIKDFPLLNS